MEQVLQTKQLYATLTNTQHKYGEEEVTVAAEEVVQVDEEVFEDTEGVQSKKFKSNKFQDCAVTDTVALYLGFRWNQVHQRQPMPNRGRQCAYFYYRLHGKAIPAATMVAQKSDP